MAGDALIATLLLGGMCLAMWFLARIARRRMGLGAGTIAGDGLRVVGKRPLDQKHALYVVEIAGGRHILVGTSAEGGISKVDDISTEEFDAMSREEERPGKAPKLHVAAPAGAEGSDDADTEAGEQPRFATVGESFHHFLGKARDARASRRASGE